MLLERIKSLALNTVLAAHNAVTFVTLNLLMWRNNLFHKERWAEKGKKKPERESPARELNQPSTVQFDSSLSNISR